MSQSENGPEARPTSFGGWLRGQREARGVTVAEIIEASKISRRFLEALETDRFDTLPAPVFVRGFLREYSRVVGLDADEVMNYYLISAPPPTAERRNEPGRGAPRAAPPPSRVGLAVAVALAVSLLLGLVAGVTYWVRTRSPEPKVLVVADRAQPSAAPVPSPQPPPEVVVISEPPTPVQATETPVPALALRLVLDFQQDCWVETRVDGGRRSSELKAGGETLALEASDAIVLTLGNAPAVRVELNGRLLTLPTSGSRLVREFRIDRSLLAPEPPPAAVEPP